MQRVGLGKQKIVLAFILILLTTPTTGWLLAQLGLNETYRVQHLSAYYTRVFLCIVVESHNFPTLIESSWPVRYAPLRATVFPHMAAHAAKAEPRNCRLIQRAVWTQVDGLNRLWVMDIGWRSDNATTPQSCEPKLLVYDLLRNNAEVLRIDCSQHISPIPSKLLAVKMGPPPLGRHCDDVEKYVYFLRADDTHILAYDIIEQKWQERLLVSRKYGDDLPEILPIKPIDMAFGQRRELLIADIDGALYSTKNALLLPQSEVSKGTNIYANAIKKQTKQDTGTAGDLTTELVMERLGSLLGPCRGMMVNYMDVLYYVVPKFGAVVRCPQYRQNLTAEGNEIIYLTSKNIQQIFFGSEESVWLVTDRLLQPDDHCFAGLT